MYEHMKEADERSPSSDPNFNRNPEKDLSESSVTPDAVLFKMKPDRCDWFDWFDWCLISPSGFKLRAKFMQTKVS